MALIKEEKKVLSFSDLTDAVQALIESTPIGRFCEDLINGFGCEKTDGKVYVSKATNDHQYLTWIEVAI